MSDDKPPVFRQTSPLSPATPSTFPRQAAMFSLAAPFVGIGVNVIVAATAKGHRGAMLIGGLTSITLIVAGLALGTVALVRNRKQHLEGVTPRAVGGICISAFLILMMAAGLPGLLRALEKAKARQQQAIEESDRP